MIELARVEEWLIDILTGDATLTGLVGTRIYNQIAPLGVTLPFVVFNWQASRDVFGLGTIRIMMNGLYTVKVVDDATTGMAAAVAIADQLDTLLHAASGTVADAAILAVMREEQINYVETTAGEHFRHLGGIYRVVAQAT